MSFNTDVGNRPGCDDRSIFSNVGTLTHTSTPETGAINKEKLIDDFSEAMAKCPQFFRDYINLCKPQLAKTEHTLRPWQEASKTKLDGETNDRHIVFVVDNVGNTGKTWFSYHYARASKDTKQN